MPETPRIPEILTKAAFARRRGCTRAAVTIASRAGGPLYEARSGKGIDATHPAAVFWLSQGAPAKTSAPPRPSKKRPRGAPEKPAAPSADEVMGSEFRRATLRKREVELAALEIKLQREQGALISRELVTRHVFGALQTMAVRLLNDVPRNLSGRMPACASPVDRETTIREAISAVLAHTKERIVRTLRELAPEDSNLDEPSTPETPSDDDDRKRISRPALRGRRPARVRVA